MRQQIHIYIILTLLLTLPSVAQSQERLSLDDCIALAIDNNIHVRTAMLAEQQAVQQRREMFTSFFPSISASAGAFTINKYVLDVSFMNTPVMQYIKTGGFLFLNATQPLYAGGRLLNGNALAKVGISVSQLKTEKTIDEVCLQTETYYWDLIVLQAKLTTVSVVDSLLSRLASDVTVAINAGVRMPNDLLQVQLRQNELDGDKVTLEHAIVTTRRLLAQYIGKDEVDISETLDFSTVPPFPADLRRDHATILLATKDYQLLEQNVRAATLTRRLEVGKHLPQLAIGGALTRHNILDDHQNLAFLYATLSVPLSSWWGGAHAIKRMKYAESIAKEELADTAERLLIQLDNYWNAIEETYSQLSIAQRAIAQSEENLRINSNCYAAGTIPLSELLQAQTIYQQSTDRFLRAYADYRLALRQYAIATEQTAE